MKLEGYTQFGGHHRETAAVQHVLAHQGVTAPHTGQPFTESMLLGIGGGIGFVYFVFEFTSPDFFYQGVFFSLSARYHDHLIPPLCERLGLPRDTRETGSARKAVANITGPLERGVPVIAWADRLHLPYYRLSPRLVKWAPPVPVVVYGYDEDGGAAYLAEISERPLTVPLDAFAQARSAQSYIKNRTVVIEPPPAPPDLPAAIRAGIRACWQALLEPRIRNLGVPGLEKWAALLVNPRDAKGWPRAFPPGARMYDGLRAIYEALAVDDTPGQGFRAMYADFLDEASGVVNEPELSDVAEHYRECAALWQALAEAALPESIPAFAETRDLLHRRRDLLVAQGEAAGDEIAAINERLHALSGEMDAAFPLSDAEAQSLRENLHDHIERLYEAESAAAHALKGAVPA
jgi:hypothetical protein